MARDDRQSSTTRRNGGSRRNPARLLVDPIACSGVGLCSHLVPDLIELDRWGFPRVTTPTVDSQAERDARRAVAACPRRALHLIHRAPASEISSSQ